MHIIQMKTFHYILAIGLASVLSLPLSGQVTTAFVQHSSGLFLWPGSDGRGTIVDAASTELQPLSLVPCADGSVLLAHGEGEAQRYLTLEGSWSTYFLSDSTTSRARFTMESTASGLRFRCQSNGKYLGTDKTTSGSHVYADKDGTKALHQWRLAESVDEEFPTDTISYFIDVASRLQLNQGWGVSLCWWANMCGKWDDAKIDQIVDWLVSPTGLNYNIFRYNIGGGDDPLNRNCTPHHMGSGKGLRAEMEGFKDSTLDVYHWDRDAAQRKIMLKIREKRPDAIFEAFSNSAPYYMTYSGCVAGNTSAGKDNLKPEYYEEFAHYLVDVCRHYADEYGIVFRTLEPFNEPNTNYWGANGGQEGCHFDFASQVAFLRVLAPILRDSGLPTVISASDETSVSTSVSGFKAYQEADVLHLVGQWNTHTYSAGTISRAQVGTLARNAGLPLWQSETGSGGSGIGGNLSLMRRAIDDIRLIMPDAWIDWQYMEENNDQWCTIRGSFANQTYQRVKSYYCHQQLTRFIPVGHRFVTTTEPTTLAALSPGADTLVLVVINEGVTPVIHRAQMLCGQPDINRIQAWRTSESEDLQRVSPLSQQGSELVFSLPGQSITTLLIPLTHAEEAYEQPEPGRPYLIQPQYNPQLTLTAGSGGGLSIEPVSLHPSQVWTLVERDGALFLQNAEGNWINDGGSSYAMLVTDSQAEATPLSLVSLDPYFHAIMTDATYAFDLNRESYSAGTQVGHYAYGSSPSAAHRNWHFTPLPTSGDEDGVEEIRNVEVGENSSSDGGKGIFDLTGRPVTSPRSKGIYIRQGRKFIVK